MSMSHKNAVNEYLVKTEDKGAGLDLFNTNKLAKLQQELERLKIHTYFLETVIWNHLSEEISALLQLEIKELKNLALKHLRNPENNNWTDLADSQYVNFFYLNKQLSEQTKWIDDVDIQIVDALKVSK